MRENCTYSLSGGRWPARKRATSDPTAKKPVMPGEPRVLLRMCSEEEKKEVMTVSLTTPSKIRELQKKLYVKAKQEPNYRFYLLYDKIYREDILTFAYELARANQGAPGWRGDLRGIESGVGLEAWLSGLRKELQDKTYQPKPVRRVMIPKPGGGERALGIRLYGTEWLRTPPNWCWNRSLKLIWSRVPTAIGLNAARRMPFRKYTNTCGKGIAM